jgi:outer membrane protein TolC
MPLGRPRLAGPAAADHPGVLVGVDGVLDVEALVQQVLARSPSLAQMVAAAQAASARYPQVTSLDDPMFGTTVAPGSIGSPEVEFGYRLEISQKYPFPGKLALRGQGAQAEASAAGHDVEDVRLQLVESTKAAFYEYYLVGRALAVNEENLALLHEFRGNAETRYKAGLVSEQDVLQAEVELGRQGERQLTLQRMRQVAIARINTLLHLPPDAPLPATPTRLSRPAPLPEASVLRSAALARRPDLQALADRIRAEQASLALAQKDFRPDFEATAAYDTIMGNGPTRDLAAQVGVRLNLPVRRAKRYAALAEAQARIAQRQAELGKLVDQVNLQVQEAYEQARESEKVIELYDATILPAADANVKAAQSAYVTAKIPFLSLIEAQRNLILLRDRRYEAIADYFRRRATLERVVGGLLVSIETNSPPPTELQHR